MSNVALARIQQMVYLAEDEKLKQTDRDPIKASARQGYPTCEVH